MRAAALAALLPLAACAAEAPPAPAPCAPPPAAEERKDAAADDAPRAPVDGPAIVVLGSGTPIPDPARSGPAAAIVAGGAAYLVDFGPGVVRRAEEAHRAGIAALDPRLLTRAFATHLHSDHTAGYADLLLTPAVVGRAEPLRVFGPPGLRAMTERLLAAYASDSAARGESGADLSGHGADVTEIPAPDGMVEVYRDENVVVRAFGVSHGAVRGALGYRFDAAGRSFVVSGDTAPSEAVVAACDGCDVLLHEVYCARGLLVAEPGFAEYHRSHHTSATELSALAARARPKVLAATHVLDFGCDGDEIRAELAASFGGRAVLAADLDVL